MPLTEYDLDQDERRWCEFTFEELEELSALFMGVDEYYLNYRLACELERQIHRELQGREVKVDL